MKKIICLLITVALLFTTADTAFAKKHDDKKNNKKHETQEKKDKKKDDKQEFKIDESPIFEYGNYKLPLAPITKGIGASVSFEKNTSVLTITKGTIKIVINFKDKSVYVNDVKDNKSGIFTGKNDNKKVVLIKYIAKILCVNIDIDDDDIIVEVPDLDLPSNIVITPVGGTVKANTLNNTTLYLMATANITAGKAVGGRAELYVGATKVASDTVITDTDTFVSFSTSDNTPTNAELQSIIPKGGEVTVKLYNSSNKVVTSKGGNPALIVDYVNPTLTGISSASYNTGSNLIKLNVTGASAVGDKVDVTRIIISDYALGRSYQLTTNSTGVVKGADLIEINLGSTDKLALTGYGSTSTYLTLATGSFIIDAAGNVAPGFTSNITIPLTVTTALEAPTKVTVTPVGTIVLANTLNSTTTHLIVTANIIAGQATGGRAELYVGNRLVAVDSTIYATDNSLYFTTSDNTPTNAELQSMVPSGGVVTVKLYNAYNNSVTSSVANPTLVVDYVAPTITSITSAIYNVKSNQLYVVVTGAGSVGDKVDVTKLVLYETTTGKSYQLTNNATTGSNGTVLSSTSLLINIGSTDKANLSSFGTTNVYLNVNSGALITDAAGNSNISFTSNQAVQVTVVK